MNDISRDTASWQQEALDHLDSLYGFAMTLTRDRPEAEELVQETYVRAVQNFARLRPDSNLKGWLFIIMRNTWAKQLRHARNGPAFVALDDSDAEHEPVDGAGDPQVLYVRFWEREEIRSALASLPRACREIIVLRDIEGFSYKEMAEMLDCPVGTIMSRLARSRAKLRRLLSRRCATILKQHES